MIKIENKCIKGRRDERVREKKQKRLRSHYYTELLDEGPVSLDQILVTFITLSPLKQNKIKLHVHLVCSNIPNR